ncbi:sigma 54-interacting transcriptional regulator [Pyxidicoccus trucidator]|uniref:sigma 54-interacting transcriptional regulator n=1 Tax=Pyxidicoccus trucidator TaxID=2709662 RepID=UPI0013DC0107|nr:sigma 54-interacting transcriptional regulator [Pyxidicoccus trucidator]
MRTGADTQEDTGPGSERTEGAKPPRPGLVVIFSGGTPLLRPVGLDGGRVMLGREDVGGQPLPDDRVSRLHAEVGRDPGGWSVTDLNSRNGTWVDGVQVTGRRTFTAPRTLRVGNTVALFTEDVRRFEVSGVTTGPEGVRGPALRAVLERVALAAAANEGVLITGESGTGKELAARAYHRAGPHARGRFVAIHCAAVPAAVVERLLFGSKRGAEAGVEGYLQAADRGVLFLDEVGGMAPEVQAKLLRVLETGEVLALGASLPRPVDVRVCAASLRDLSGAVAAGQLRADLYARLARCEVHLPPLRERLEEVPWLLAQAMDAGAPEMHASFVEACLARPWPGNVRELLGEAKRAVREAQARGAGTLRAEHLALGAGFPLSSEDVTPFIGFRGAPVSVELDLAGVMPDRAAVEAALASQEGRVSEAARMLGLDRAQLSRLMRRWGMASDSEE